MSGKRYQSTAKTKIETSPCVASIPISNFVLGAAGFTPDNIDMKCTIPLENGAITENHLEIKAFVPNIGDAKVNECIADVKENCLISKLLNTNITIEASLQQAVNA